MKKWIIVIGTIVLISGGLMFFQHRSEAPQVSQDPQELHEPMSEAETTAAIEQAIDHVEELEGLEEGIEKWAVRLLVASNESLSDAELVAQAEQAYQKRQDALDVAEEVYDVDMSEERIHAFIEQEVEQIDEAFMTSIASAHGLSLEAFLYDWEYDNFAYNYAWREVGARLEEDFPIQEGEDAEAYRERLTEEWQNKIDETR
ncbi:hypothetical protein MM326_03655 [Alkalihalobacillus sp. LMS6]|uniref:hypothetical protein n=1 Tax=Alkalihalobacillus sp. LMS6 TaxID=2924034 RepID=UPI0020D18A13|nr:hypothetical protein [Alkalihalobacillus sp. LMS6]UTR07141.1 hypothetical protein MM326_03655 [Alkalihalobacillus sp. LMS6]